MFFYIYSVHGGSDEGHTDKKKWLSLKTCARLNMWTSRTSGRNVIRSFSNFLSAIVCFTFRLPACGLVLFV